MANPELQLRLARQLEADHPGLVAVANTQEIKDLRADAQWSRLGAARDASFVRLAQRAAREGRSVRLLVQNSGEVLVWASRDADPGRAVSVCEVQAPGGPTPFGTRLRDLVEHAPPEALHGPALGSASTLRRLAAELMLHTPGPVLACQLVELRARGAAQEGVWILTPSTTGEQPVARLRVTAKGDTVRAAALEWLAERPAPRPASAPEPPDREQALQALFDQAAAQAEEDPDAPASATAPPAPPPKEGLFTRALAAQAPAPRSHRRPLLGLALLTALFAWKVNTDREHEQSADRSPSRQARRAAPPVTTPTVRLARAPTVFGKLRAQELTEAMQPVLEAMALCYRFALEQRPDEEGLDATLELRLVIDEHGGLSKVSIGPEFAGNPALASCATDAASAAAWPQPDEPGAVLASYWLEFVRPPEAGAGASAEATADAPPAPGAAPEDAPEAEPTPAATAP